MPLNSPLGFPPTAAFLGTTFLGLSTIPLFNAQKAYDLFGLPLYYPPITKTSTQSSVGVESAPSTFLYVTAARDVMVGVAHFILGFQHNTDGIRALMFATSVAAEIDAYIVWKYGGLEYGGWHGRWIIHALSGLIHGIVAFNGWGL